MNSISQVVRLSCVFSFPFAGCYGAKELSSETAGVFGYKKIMKRRLCLVTTVFCVSKQRNVKRCLVTKKLFFIFLFLKVKNKVFLTIFFNYFSLFLF